MIPGGLQGALLAPTTGANVWGVLVLAGSSGRVDETRAQRFADLGCVAFAQRWFGGEGQSPGICEIPLETFVAALDRLAEAGARRFAIAGVSKGAEAAVLTAVRDHRVGLVCAISPSSHVWAQIGAGLDGVQWPERSSWTWRDEPLPFVPSDVTWAQAVRDGAVAYRGFHEQSLAKAGEAAPWAAIPIEEARADFVLVCGADDALWPSDTMGEALHRRLQAAGRDADLIVHPDAGHQVPLPGEASPAPNPVRAWGGRPDADAELGARAWDAIMQAMKN